MSARFPSHYWAVVLGGSSGFGLATAQKLAEHGMNCFVVHRDRRGAMVRIEPDFARIREQGVSLVSMNVDALDPAVREECLARLAVALGPDGRVRVLLHSIALGNLKLLLPERARERPTLAALAAALGVDAADLAAAANRLFGEGFDPLAPLTDSPAYPSSAFLDEEDFARTIHASVVPMSNVSRKAFVTSFSGWKCPRPCRKKVTRRLPRRVRHRPRGRARRSPTPPRRWRGGRSRWPRRGAW